MRGGRSVVAIVGDRTHFVRAMQAVGLVLDAGSLTGVPALDERLRVEVCRSFSATGRAPDVMELAVAAGVDPDAVSGGLQRLADARHLVLGADGAIVMAHPFASMPLGFAVMGQHALWWGGCAWDSFAIPHLVPDEPEALVSTRCPGCGKALAWVVGRAGAPGGEEVAHFLVPMARVWDGRHHLRQPATLLRRSMRAAVAGRVRPAAWVRHGPRHAVAAGGALVRGAAGRRVRPARAGPGSRLLPRGRAQWPVLGSRLNRTQTDPTPVIVTSMIPAAAHCSETQPTDRRHRTLRVTRLGQTNCRH